MTAYATMLGRLALGGGCEQCAQTGEAVGGDASGGDEFAEGIFEFSAQQSRGVDQFVEEQGALCGECIDHGLCA